MSRIASLIFTLASAAVLSCSAPRAQLDDETSLIGLWVSETTFGTMLSGELTIERHGSGWRAELEDAATDFVALDDELRFAFAGGRGQFRGALSENGETIEGFWIQPSGQSDDDEEPGGRGQPFATPVILARTGAGAWRGEVQPLKARFTLYLRVFRGDDGALLGAFRNPEFNARGGVSQFRVASSAGVVRFSAGSDPAAPDIVHEARLESGPERLRIYWPAVGRELELTRREPNDAAAYFPRAPGAARYVYARPLETGDGWRTARARDVGFDEEALSRAVRRIIESDPAASRPSLIHSLLVARRGRLVLEEYFFGHDRDTPHDTRSAGKTFASVMLGAAMMGGADISPETRVYEIFDDAGPFANPDPRKSEISMAHLMTHTSGLACDDNDGASPGNEETMQSQTREPDWARYTLDLPMAHAPGERYAYCSANMNLAGAALSAATSTWLPELFDRTIARPLQFGRYHWNLTPTNDGYLGGGAFLRPRDLLKVGQAYLDGGVWNGRRIVEAFWVERSTAPRVEVSPETTGLDPSEFGNAYIEATDAYAWHLFDIQSGDEAHRAYAATGNGGQMLIVVPELELVVVFTGGNYMQGGIWLRWRDDIVGGEIISAIIR